MDEHELPKSIIKVKARAKGKGRPIHRLVIHRI
jgi:hypothetical protein